MTRPGRTPDGHRHEPRKSLRAARGLPPRPDGPDGDDRARHRLPFRPSSRASPTRPRSASRSRSPTRRNRPRRSPAPGTSTATASSTTARSRSTSRPSPRPARTRSPCASAGPAPPTRSRSPARRSRQGSATTPTATPTPTADARPDGHPRPEDQPPAGRPHRQAVRPARPDRALPRAVRQVGTAEDLRRAPSPATPKARSSATSGTPTATASSRPTPAPTPSSPTPTSTRRPPRSSCASPTTTARPASPSSRSPSSRPSARSSCSSERLYVSGQCLRNYPIKHGVQYRSKFPVSVNGITSPRRPTSRSWSTSSAAACSSAPRSSPARPPRRFPFKSENIVLQNGPLHWVLKNNQLQNVGSLNGRKLNGLRITGAPEDSIDLPEPRRRPHDRFYLKLPDRVRRRRRPRSRRAHRRLAEGEPADRHRGRRRRRVQLHRPERLDRPDRPRQARGHLRRRGPVGDRGQRARSRCIDAHLGAKAGILNGDFNYAGAELGFGNPGRRPVRPGLPAADQVPRRGRPEARASASRISASRPRSSSATSSPTTTACRPSRCAARSGSPAGPQILGASAISLDAGLGLATYDDRPSVFRAYGDMKVVSIPFADATFEAHTDGFVKVSGKFHYGWDGFASARRPPRPSACSARSSTPRAA